MSLLVLGGGRLGAAIARAATVPARVLSPTPRPHAGLWQRWSAGEPIPVERARVVVAVAPRTPSEALPLYRDQLPRLVAEAWRGGAERVTVCGPAGRGHPVADAFVEGVARLPPRTVVLRVGALFGTDDASLWPLVTALREHGTVRLPGGVPPTRWLWLDDAARAAHRLDAGHHTLLGHEQLTPEAFGERLVARFGGTCRPALWGRAACVPELEALRGEADDWERAGLGERLSVGAWVAKLPGLRRGR